MLSIHQLNHLQCKYQETLNVLSQLMSTLDRNERLPIPDEVTIEYLKDHVDAITQMLNEVNDMIKRYNQSKVAIEKIEAEITSTVWTHPSPVAMVNYNAQPKT